MSSKKEIFKIEWAKMWEFLQKEAGFKCQEDLARYLEVSPTYISKIKREGRFPDSKVIKFAKKSGRSIEEIVAMGSQGSSKNQKRRVEDKFYCEVNPLPGAVPREKANLPPFKMFFNTDFYQVDCQTSKIGWTILRDNTFAPLFCANDILLVDLSDKTLRNGYYLLEFKKGSFVVRKICPVDDQSLKVFPSPDESSVQYHQWEKLEKLIFGRILWVVNRV